MTMVKKTKGRPVLLPVRVETRLRSSEVLDLDKARKTIGLSRNQLLRQAWLSYREVLRQEGVL